MGMSQSTMAGIGAIAIGILVLVVAFTIIPVVGDQIDQAVTIQGDEAATATLTFSGNASCGEFINITTATGTTIPFEMNITGATECSDKKTWTDDVVMALGTNTSTNAATNLTTSINANDTISAVMTATNPSAGVVVITYDTASSEGNGVALAETAAAAAWDGTYMAGGADGSDWNSEHNTDIPTGVDLWESIGGIIKIAAIILIVGGFLKTLQGLKSNN